MRERQPSLGLLILALMAACVGIWLWPSATSRHTESTTRSLEPPVSAPATVVNGAEPAPGASASASGGAEAAGSPATEPAGAEQAAPRPLSAKTRELRQKVLAAAQERRRKAPTAPDPSSTPAPAAPPVGTMLDKTGELGEEVRVLNEQFAPLFDECQEQAQERNPRLGGMLALNMRFASAEGIGGIIESVEPAPDNEVKDDELIECLRQSAFSIELPAPSTGRDTDRQLTIPVEPRETARAAEETPPD